MQDFRNTNYFYKAFLFLISSLVVLNLFSFSPIFYQRFSAVSFSIFYIYMYLLYANNTTIRLKKYIVYSLLFYSLYVTNALRFILEYTTPMFYSPLLSNVISSKEVVTMWKFLFGS